MRALHGIPVVFTAFALFLFASVASAASFPIPEFTPNVVDPRGLLDAAKKEQVNLALQRIRQTSHVWGAVFIVDTLDGEPIENVAVKAFEQWKLGRAGVDNGLLLVLSINDRKSRFEVGYGLEGTITDAAARRALSFHLAPKMRQGDTAGAIVEAFDFLSRLVALDPDAMRELEKPATPVEYRLFSVRGFFAWGMFLLAVWSCVPCHNAWVRYRRQTLLQQHPALGRQDEEVVKTMAKNDMDQWKRDAGLLALLSFVPGLFMFFMAQLQNGPYFAGVLLPLLVTAVIVYASSYKFFSFRTYRHFLDGVAKQRAHLIKLGHVEETQPGMFAYTRLYYQFNSPIPFSSSSRRRSSYSSSSRKTSPPSSSGGGRSGGGGASSGW